MVHSKFAALETYRLEKVKDAEWNVGDLTHCREARKEVHSASTKSIAEACHRKDMVHDHQIPVSSAQVLKAKHHNVHSSLGKIHCQERH